MTSQTTVVKKLAPFTEIDEKRIQERVTNSYQFPTPIMRLIMEYGTCSYLWNEDLSVDCYYWYYYIKYDYFVLTCYTLPGTINRICGKGNVECMRWLLYITNTSVHKKMTQSNEVGVVGHKSWKMDSCMINSFRENCMNMINWYVVEVEPTLDQIYDILRYAMAKINVKVFDLLEQHYDKQLEALLHMGDPHWYLATYALNWNRLDIVEWFMSRFDIPFDKIFPSITVFRIILNNAKDGEYHGPLVEWMRKKLVIPAEYEKYMQ